MFTDIKEFSDVKNWIPTNFTKNNLDVDEIIHYLSEWLKNVNCFTDDAFCVNSKHFMHEIYKELLEHKQ